MPGTWGGRLMAEVWSLSAHALTLASITVSVTPRRSSRKPQPDASSNGRPLRRNRRCRPGRADADRNRRVRWWAPPGELRRGADRQDAAGVGGDALQPSEPADGCGVDELVESGAELGGRRHESYRDRGRSGRFRSESDGVALGRDPRRTALVEADRFGVHGVRVGGHDNLRGDRFEFIVPPCRVPGQSRTALLP
jgi:hypothetical protein